MAEHGMHIQREMKRMHAAMQGDKTMAMPAKKSKRGKRRSPKKRGY